jgi:prophage DNA circulation protein
VFYNADGSYSDHFTANDINEKNFCQGVENLLKNSARDIRSISINSKNILDDISDTVRKRYKLNQELSEAQSKLRAKTQKDRKNPAKVPSSSNSSELSEKKIEALAEESKKLDNQIAQLKNKYSTFGIKSVSESTDKSGLSVSSE